MDSAYVFGFIEPPKRSRDVRSDSISPRLRTKCSRSLHPALRLERPEWVGTVGRDLGQEMELLVDGGAIIEFPPLICPCCVAWAILRAGMNEVFGNKVRTARE